MCFWIKKSSRHWKTFALIFLVANKNVKLYIDYFLVCKKLIAVKANFSRFRFQYATWMGSVLFRFLKSHCQGSFGVYKKLSKMKIKIYQIHYGFCTQQENFKLEVDSFNELQQLQQLYKCRKCGYFYIKGRRIKPKKVGLNKKKKKKRLLFNFLCWHFCKYF